MKNLTFLAIAAIFSSCATIWEKPISKENLSDAITELGKVDTIANGKKRFLGEMIPLAIGLSELAPKDVQRPTFREVFDIYSKQYDSTANAIRVAQINNDRLKGLIASVDDIYSFASDQYRSSFGLKLTLNNTFEKDILYIILNYKLIDEYDTEFFNEKVKITDKSISGNQVEFLARNEYDQISTWMWKKAPSNDAKRKEVLMKNLVVEPLLVVFTDKSEVVYQKVEWQYL